MAQSCQYGLDDDCECCKGEIKCCDAETRDNERADDFVQIPRSSQHGVLSDWEEEIHTSNTSDWNAPHMGLEENEKWNCSTSITFCSHTDTAYSTTRKWRTDHASRLGFSLTRFRRAIGFLDFDERCFIKLKRCVLHGWTCWGSLSCQDEEVQPLSCTQPLSLLLSKLWL